MGISHPHADGSMELYKKRMIALQTPFRSGSTWSSIPSAPRAKLIGILKPIQGCIDESNSSLMDADVIRPKKTIARNMR
jgi:hypothetical protein